jgi:hypothetical protein
MQSTNVRQIKAALRDQAFLGTTRVCCPLGRVVAVSRWKGQLRVMIRGWGRWYPVESVRIERTGPQLLQEGLTWSPPTEVLTRSPAEHARSAGE